MGTIKRLSRVRKENRDAIQLAWDEGLPPPAEAFDPANQDELIGAIFFRWAERPPAWTGHHPHFREWLDALRSL
jgi:hypothetical protein